MRPITTKLIQALPGNATLRPQNGLFAEQDKFVQMMASDTSSLQRPSSRAYLEQYYTARRDTLEHHGSVPSSYSAAFNNIIEAGLTLGTLQAAAALAVQAASLPAPNPIPVGPPATTAEPFRSHDLQVVQFAAAKTTLADPAHMAQLQGEAQASRDNITHAFSMMPSTFVPSMQTLLQGAMAVGSLQMALALFPNTR